MHFGVYLNPPTAGRHEDSRRIDDVVRQVELAQERGFRAAWLTEHHFTGYNTYSDTQVMAGFLAGRTPGLRVGFSLAIPHLHHPVRFAEQCNLLDQLKKGDFIVGIGSGYGQVEFDGFAMDAARRRDDFDEAVDLLFRLWEHQDGVLEFDTGRWKGRIDGRIIPSSFRQPYPLVARGSVRPDAAEAWGALGRPALFADLTPEHVREMTAAYSRGLERAPITPEQRQELREWSPVVQVVHLAETDEQAMDDFLRYGNQHLVDSHFANQSERATFEQLAATRVERWWAKTIVGSPNTAIAKFQELRSLGIGHVMCWMNIGGAPHELVARTIDLMAREVIPALSERSRA